MNYKLECEVVEVKKWTLKMVNISRTGYYAVILGLIDFKITGEKFLKNGADITSIIYEPNVKEKMEVLRLNDMRKFYK